MVRLRLLGICFVALLLAGVWLTYAVFTQRFTSFEEITMKSSSVGLQLPARADVKIRGVLIGQVLSTRADADGATLTLGIKPEHLDSVPSNITGAIVPKTLFGEKYVALEIPDSADSADSEVGAVRPIKAGAVVKSSVVAPEIEAVLNDLYPLLRSIDPADLNGTLNALATALEGRGETLGGTIVTAERYLSKLNPLLPTFVDDLRKTAAVSSTYATLLPKLGAILRDSLLTAGTLEDQAEPVATLLAEVDRTSTSTRLLLAENEKSLTQLASINEALLEATARYSSGFPCLFGGLDAVGIREAGAFRNYMLHIVLETLPNQPRKYTAADKPRTADDRGPTCGRLPNPPWSQANPHRAQPNILDGVQGAVR